MAQIIELQDEIIKVSEYNRSLSSWGRNSQLRGRNNELYMYLANTIRANSPENLIGELLEIPNFAEISIREYGEREIKAYRRDIDFKDLDFFQKFKNEQVHSRIKDILDNGGDSQTISVRFQSSETIEENRRRDLLARTGVDVRNLPKFDEERSLVLFKGQTSKNIFAYRAKIPVCQLVHQNLYKLTQFRRDLFLRDFPNHTIEAILQ